jgi:hypothetical protein
MVTGPVLCGVPSDFVLDLLCNVLTGSLFISYRRYACLSPLELPVRTFQWRVYRQRGQAALMQLVTIQHKGTMYASLLPANKELDCRLVIGLIVVLQRKLGCMLQSADLPP